MIVVASLRTLSRMSQASMTTNQWIEEDGHTFPAHLLYDNKNLSVRVEETEKVDFSEVTEHLDLGGSVLITYRRT